MKTEEKVPIAAIPKRTKTLRKSGSAKNAYRIGRFAHSMHSAKTLGLLEGKRTVVVRARMPAALLQAAKKNSGVQSNSRLLELALSHVATEDDYLEWLHSQRGTIPAGIDFDL